MNVLTASPFSERSQSLWTQLLAPPPLQPPNWVRSRIRRLFLVSLGVPVDLDEILPASKQKKLVLPLMESSTEAHSPLSTETKGTSAVSRSLQADGRSTSGQSVSFNGGEDRRRGPPPPPKFDFRAAMTLCSTTEAALAQLDEEGLKSHIAQLHELQARASEVLEYWLRRRDNALGDKEAFEGVIENLVKHAKKFRK
jgi:hypothetical protein